MGIQEAIEATRVELRARPDFYKPGAEVSIGFESRLPEAARKALEAKGNKIRVEPRAVRAGVRRDAGDSRQPRDRHADRRRGPAARGMCARVLTGRRLAAQRLAEENGAEDDGNDDTTSVCVPDRRAGLRRGQRQWPRTPSRSQPPMAVTSCGQSPDAYTVSLLASGRSSSTPSTTCSRPDGLKAVEDARRRDRRQREGPGRSRHRREGRTRAGRRSCWRRRRNSA